MRGVNYAAGLNILIGRETIAAGVKRISEELTAVYQNRHPLLLAVLKGSVVFLSDLLRHLDFPLEVDFIRISSYGNGTSSSGIIESIRQPLIDIENRHVIIIEDIVDTGHTTEYLFESLHQKSPASIAICALLNKPSRRVCNVSVDFSGFEIPDRFVVGYGLDLGEEFRNLPDICYIEQPR